MTLEVVVSVFNVWCCNFSFTMLIFSSKSHSITLCCFSSDSVVIICCVVVIVVVVMNSEEEICLSLLVVFIIVLLLVVVVDFSIMSLLLRLRARFKFWVVAIAVVIVGDVCFVSTGIMYDNIFHCLVLFLSFLCSFFFLFQAHKQHNHVVFRLSQPFVVSAKTLKFTILHHTEKSISYFFFLIISVYIFLLFSPHTSGPRSPTCELFFHFFSRFRYLFGEFQFLLETTNSWVH